MTTGERLDRLAGIVDPLASTVVAHNNRIEALIGVTEKLAIESKAIDKRMDDLIREWQAYLRTIHPRQ